MFNRTPGGAQAPRTSKGPPSKNPYWVFLTDFSATWGGSRADSKTMRLVNRLVRTGDHLWTLRNSTGPYAKEAAIEKYIINQGLVAMAYRADIFLVDACQGLPKETLLNAEGEEAGSLYKVTVAKDLYTWFREFSEHTTSFVMPGTLEEVNMEVREYLWRRFENNILFSLNEKNLLKVSAAPSSGDYVDSQDMTTLLNDVSFRIKKFKDAGIPRSLLLKGPPGTGKTTMAGMVSKKVGGRFLTFDLDLLREYGSNFLLRHLKILEPDIVLIDEIDRNPSRALDIMKLLESHDWEHPITVIGTVNSIEVLDPALLRPGRFDEVLHVGAPTAEYLLKIVEHYAEKYGVTRNAKVMAYDMRGFSPADVREVIVSTGIVGADVYKAEIARVKLQQQYYTGSACKEFLSGDKEDSDSSPVFDEVAKPLSEMIKDHGQG